MKCAGPNRPAPKGGALPDPQFYSRLGRLSAVVLIIPSSMAAGWIFGSYILDRYLPISPWGAVACTLLGAAAGFYELFKILMTDQRRKNG